MSSLKLYNVCKIFTHNGEELKVLDNVNMELAQGSLTTMVGHSGCGKTTLLRVISRLEEPTCGEIDFGQEHARIGFVFQEPRLMPWLNLQDNIQFLSQEKNPKKADEILDLIGLTRYAKFFPHQISGGMAHRVGLGRTLYYNPDIILMDEPFAALDYFTRAHMQEELLRIFKEIKKTLLFVTHNLEEAIMLADNLLLLKSGAIEKPFGSEDLQHARKDPLALQNMKNHLIAQLSTGMN